MSLLVLRFVLDALHDSAAGEIFFFGATYVTSVTCWVPSVLPLFKTTSLATETPTTASAVLPPVLPYLGKEKLEELKDQTLSAFFRSTSPLGKFRLCSCPGF